MAAEAVIKVVALCGSLREASYNRGLLNAGTPFSFLLCFSVLLFSVFYPVFSIRIGVQLIQIHAE